MGPIERITFSNGPLSPDPRDALILSLCEKLYICSRLLTRAAEKLKWDRVEVQSLVTELKNSLKESHHASIQQSQECKDRAD